MSDQPSVPPQKWQGWARTPGKPWQKIDGSLCETKGGCYALLMELVELRGHRETKNELLILPEGQYPPASNTYRDRMMRPMI